MRYISNTADIIDSRDIIERIEELEAEQEEAMGGFEHVEDMDDATRTAFLAWEADNGNELDTLRNLAEEAEGYAPDWKYGATLVRDSYFTEYAQDLAEECGMIPRDLGWPCTCIDWDQAARELKMDYTAVDFDGVTYWVR